MSDGRVASISIRTDRPGSDFVSSPILIISIISLIYPRRFVALAILTADFFLTVRAFPDFFIGVAPFLDATTLLFDADAGLEFFLFETVSALDKPFAEDADTGFEIFLLETVSALEILDVDFFSGTLNFDKVGLESNLPAEAVPALFFGGNADVFFVFNGVAVLEGSF